jgi:hypothetical protein
MQNTARFCRSISTRCDMANVFDQFDTSSDRRRNIFDKFDPPKTASRMRCRAKSAFPASAIRP